MYSSNQTLVNKETKRLAALYNPKPDSIWHWGGCGDTLFIDENGKVFEDKLSNYTHISDEFGRACFTPEGKRTNKYVDDRLKYYVELSKSERKSKRKEKIKEKVRKVLSDLDTKGESHHVFCDGAQNWYMSRFFAKFMKVCSICNTYKHISLFKYNGSIFFWFNGSIYKSTIKEI